MENRIRFLLLRAVVVMAGVDERPTRRARPRGGQLEHLAAELDREAADGVVAVAVAAGEAGGGRAIRHQRDRAVLGHRDAAAGRKQSLLIALRAHGRTSAAGLEFPMIPL